MVSIRPIKVSDNPVLATIIRSTLAEFGANKPGTVYYDDTTDHLYELFQTPGAGYFVAEMNDKIVGGGGIYPTEGLPAGTCELVKMYLLPEARGTGLGKRIIDMCIDFAGKNGYDHIYLESMPELQKALKVYEKFGFTYLTQPLGNSGHTGCSLWMIRTI